MRDPRKLAPWKYSSVLETGLPRGASEESQRNFIQRIKELLTEPELTTELKFEDKENEMVPKRGLFGPQEPLEAPTPDPKYGMVENTSNTTPMIPDESFVRPLMEADERKKIWNEAIETAAITAWTHYMETCKNKSAHPANYGEFIASSAIRKLSK